MFLLIGAGVLVLVLVVVAVVLGSTRDRTPVSSPPAGSVTPAAAAKPSDAVQGFLDAVAASDATRALGYLDDQPPDATFASDAVLKASASRAPLSNVVVPVVTDENAYRVSATFDLGSRHLSRDFAVSKGADGWQLTDAVADVDVTYERQASLPMVVNGTKVTADHLYLLPGTYTFTTGSRWVSYGSSSTLTVAETYVSLPDQIKPTMTKAASRAVLARTKSAFRTCLAQHRLKPKGCPNRIDDTSGVKVDEDSVRWRVTKDPFRNARFTLDSDDPTIAEATFYPDYRIRVAGTRSGRRVSGETSVTGISSFDAVGDLSKDTVTVKLEG